MMKPNILHCTVHMRIKTELFFPPPIFSFDIELERNNQRRMFSHKFSEKVFIAALILKISLLLMNWSIGL